MYSIDHNDAVELEHIVRSVYGCDRGGVSGMVDADYFERKPIQAAMLVVAYFCANNLIPDSYSFGEFLHKYETIFDYPEEYDVKNEMSNYIDELRTLVRCYLKE